MKRNRLMVPFHFVFTIIHLCIGDLYDFKNIGTGAVGKSCCCPDVNIIRCICLLDFPSYVGKELLGITGFGIVQNEEEFVAADTVGSASVVGKTVQDGSKFFQSSVAECMPEFIVDYFQVVQVKEKNSNTLNARIVVDYHVLVFVLVENIGACIHVFQVSKLRNTVYFVGVIGNRVVHHDGEHQYNDGTREYHIEKDDKQRAFVERNM